MPGAILSGKRPARHHIMDVGVILQLPAPGVKHAEEAGWVGVEERLDGLGGGLEQCLVAQLLVAAQKRAQGLGDGEGKHEVVAWQLAMQLSLEPLLGLAVLAAGAMTVAAGGRDAMVMAAVLALIADRTRGLGAALVDSLDGFLCAMGMVGA